MNGAGSAGHDHARLRRVGEVLFKVVKMKLLSPLVVLLALLPNRTTLCGQCGRERHCGNDRIPKKIAPFFTPPLEFADDFGNYRSPLKFYDGTAVKTRADWQKRRQEILTTWHNIMGPWPPLIEKPRIEYLEKERRGNLTQRRVSIEIAPNQQTVNGYLLVPDGKGPFPAVLVVYYDAETGAGLGKEFRDFGFQLAKGGFVTLSIGTPDFCSLRPPYKPLYQSTRDQTQLQPLSALAYVAANCYNAMANIQRVDSKRIGIIGHSYGGKWAMFASCLYEKFACTVWSDPGIVFDETRPNVNYWEPWYLGYESDKQRQRGIPSKTNPRTGAYKRLFLEGHDLHELHALMAPRPFLVSGGSEDTPERWKALNHTIAVNKLLGYTNRVAMTNRKGHAPTSESNAQIILFFEFFLGSHFACTRWVATGTGATDCKTGIQTFDSGTESSEFEKRDSNKVTERIVFSSNRSGSWRIWVMNADGLGGAKTHPAPPGSIVPAYGGTAFGELLVMRQLTKGKPDDHDVDPVFSPDAKTILFSSNRGGKIGIWKMPIDGGTPQGGNPTSNPKRLCDGEQAEWSPDGTRIVLRRNEKIYTHNLADGQEKRISPIDWPHCSGPAWSPDGKTIAFACRWDAGNAIFIVKAEGGKPAKVYDKQGACEPHWSPDGQLLAYETETHICTVQPDGKKNRLITYFGGVQRYPRWSPNGKYLVYCQGVTENGPWEIYIIPSKGGAPIKLTEGGSDMNPDWK